jgi:hypothetical protein
MEKKSVLSHFRPLAWLLAFYGLWSLLGLILVIFNPDPPP